MSISTIVFLNTLYPYDHRAKESKVVLLGFLKIPDQLWCGEEEKSKDD